MFTPTEPPVGSSYTTLRYYLDGGNFSGPFNRDFRNASGSNDVAQVDVDGFAYSVGDYTATEDTNRGREIRDLAQVLAHATAHELGHTLGLDHYDTLGDPVIDPQAVNNLTADFVMRGNLSAGNEARLETPGGLRLSPQTQAKLEFAQGLTPTPRTSLAEQATAHGDGATAQPLGLSTSTPLPISGLRAVNMIGQLSDVPEIDVYQFDALAGDIVTSNVISYQLAVNQGTSGPRPTQFDALLSFWDRPPSASEDVNDPMNLPDGVLKFSNGIPRSAPGEPTYSGTTLGVAFENQLDAMILNFEVPVDGTYYLRVERANRPSVLINNTIGDYELFTTLKAAADPPQVTGVALGNGDFDYDFAYADAVGSGKQLTSLPVEDANPISITFSEPVDPATVGTALTLTSGIPNTTYGLSFDGLERNGTIATWAVTNAGGLQPSDNVTLALSDSVKDLNDNQLDGEWVNPTSVTDAPNSGASTFRSGNGSAGGDFTFHFNTHLKGDYNNSGQVEQGDLDLVLQNWGDSPVGYAIPQWEASQPRNQIEQTDLDAVLQNWGDTGPVYDPSGGGGGGDGSSASAEPVFEDIDFLAGMSAELTFTATAPGSPDLWLWDTSSDSPWYSGYFEYDEANDNWILHQSSVQTEANGNAYLQFAENGDRTFAVIEDPTPDNTAATWDLSFDYSIPQSDGNSTVRIWALAEGESVGFGVEGGTAFSSMGDINATLLSETSLSDVTGWTTKNINNLQIPVGYGAIVIEWQTNATSGGGILGIDNLLIDSI